MNPELRTPEETFHTPTEAINTQNFLEKNRTLSFSGTTEFLKSPGLLSLGVELGTITLAWKGMQVMLGNYQSKKE